ncbi:MAG: tRNA pseudouridine(55) synthase [Patiriisocius sp.]|jgi:tRNA pseudouridine(55) synthase
MWYPSTMQKYLSLEKEVGQTPLQCVELYKETHPELQGVPMTYAGRLDPMASGTLLILLGEECKNQASYHNLDKEYTFEVLFGIGSDTADVLGRLTESSVLPEVTKEQLTATCKELTGEVELPYPHFSSKTVQGKPLHTWALEGRIDEIEIPTKKSVIHSLSCTDLHTATRQDVYVYATTKIETIPPVTQLRKAIGNDFRRVDVRKDWEDFIENESFEDTFYIATFTCTASSGTYMRTLANVIAEKCGTTGLAYSIHRNKIGTYKKIPLLGGIWKKKF